MTLQKMKLFTILGVVACCIVNTDSLSFRNEFDEIIKVVQVMKTIVMKREIEIQIAEAWENRPDIVSSHQDSSVSDTWFVGDWKDRSIILATPIDKFDNDRWEVVDWEDRPAVVTTYNGEDNIDVWNDRPKVMTTYR